VTGEDHDEEGRQLDGRRDYPDQIGRLPAASEVERISGHGSTQHCYRYQLPVSSSSHGPERRSGKAGSIDGEEYGQHAVGSPVRRDDRCVDGGTDQHGDHRNPA
jgi:hypothetical protein